MRAFMPGQRMRPQLLTFTGALGFLLAAAWQIGWSARLGGGLLAVAALHLWVNLMGAVRRFQREIKLPAPVSAH
jgi:hypothetical protein